MLCISLSPNSPFTKTHEKLNTRATGSFLASFALRSEPRDPAAPSVQLASARLAQLPAAAFVKRRKRRFSRSPSCAFPSAVQLRASSCTLGLPARSSRNFSAAPSQLQLPAAPSFKCQLPASSSLQRSSFQLPACTALRGGERGTGTGARTAARGRAWPPDAWKRSPTLSVCIIA